MKLRRILATLLLGTALATLTVGWLGSGHLVSPERRALRDYHRERLAEPERFGLAITAYTGPSQTPCLLVHPAPRAGDAGHSRELRRSLRTLGTEPPPWGSVRGTVVLLHGHTGRKEDHLPICERFCAAGFRCILPDLPGHGDHPSSVATFGHRECELVEAIVDDARSCFALPEEPVFLFGVSQGGAIALQTAARDPQRWAGVVSAASFADLDRIVSRSAGHMHPAINFAAPLTNLAVDVGTWFRGGFLPSQIRPVDAATRLTLPVMLIHGDQDRFIPPSDAREILVHIPAGHGILRMVRGAGHGRVLAEDARHLYPEICRFFLTAEQGPATKCEAIVKSGALR